MTVREYASVVRTTTIIITTNIYKNNLKRHISNYNTPLLYLSRKSTQTLSLIHSNENEEQKDYGINFSLRFYTRLCYFILRIICCYLINSKHLLISMRKKKQSHGFVSYLQNTSIDWTLLSLPQIFSASQLYCPVLFLLMLVKFRTLPFTRAPLFPLIQ